MEPVVVGVRHHSPACARLVAATVRRLRPRFVLIEGPSDCNGRLDELGLGHELPIAIFSYLTRAQGTRASWSPLCAYSPEWVALEVAREVGAEALFIDLPSYSDAFWKVKNRYADRHGPRGSVVDSLAGRLGVEDMDSLWDHLFEQPCEPPELAARLHPYFVELRAEDEVGDRDRQREAFMARWVAWAMGARGGGEVVVVCGGYHAPMLEQAWREASREPAPPRPEPPPEPEGARAGSYLVPYSFKRLDSFVGYDSGMPSPAFYQQVWELGPDRAAETMLVQAVQRLRDKKQRVSVADTIAASTLAHGLQAIRGHRAMARVDVLDGLAGALVKEALDAPLPWTRRGVLLAGTEPRIVEIVAAFSGDRIGKLAPGTPRPPLVSDAYAALELAGIPIERAAIVLELPLADPSALARSRVLHRLRILQIPGFTLERAPTFARGEEPSESWRVARALDADAALIEAAAYGATLEAAASGKLEEALHGAADLGKAALVLLEAARAGISDLAQRMLRSVQRTVWGEPSLEVLGEAMAALLALWRYDALLGVAGSADLGVVLEAAFDRGLWLFEGILGDRVLVTDKHLGALVALEHTLRDGPPRLSIDRARAHAVMERRARDAAAAPTLRGAALGFLWATEYYASGTDAEAHALATLGSVARADVLGDFLTGLFALGREQVRGARGLLAAIDAAIASMVDDAFLLAVPSLRLAFSYLPPREKAEIARQVLLLHGRDPAGSRALLQLDVSVDETLAGAALDAEIERLARRYGLDDPEEP